MAPGEEIFWATRVAGQRVVYQDFCEFRSSGHESTARESPFDRCGAQTRSLTGRRNVRGQERYALG